MSSSNKIHEIKRCRVCHNEKLVPILSLGAQYVSDFITSEKDHTEKVPLDIVLCEIDSGGCGLLQLRHTTPGELMYSHYWYQSGINESMRVALADITSCVKKMVPFKPGDMVVDIGCNDGTLLRSYAVDGLLTVGIDPAKNLHVLSSKGTTKVINDYFSAAAIRRHFPDKKPKAITAIAMFYDLDDPNSFVADAASLLDKDGVFVIQMSYLPLMLETNAFDNICHEHLEYYSLAALENLLSRHNLEVFDVSLNDVNGGSFRAYIRHKGAAVSGLDGAMARIADLRKKENEMGLNSRAVYEEFSSRVKTIGEQLSSFIRSEHAKGKKIFVYGASTKGNTLLQTYSLNYPIIEAAAERNSDKYGRKTVGTLIPIISEAEARGKKPDYFLVLPWHFMDSFIKREADYLKSGGKFIVPLPNFKVIGKEAVQ